MSEYVSQEALKFFGIKNVYFVDEGGVTVLVQPLAMKKNSWLCTCSSAVTECGTLRIAFAAGERNETTEHDISVRAKRTDDVLSLTNCHKISFCSPLPSFLTDRIAQYQKLMRRSEKRREQRFPVGQENWKKFSLKTPNCILRSMGGTSVPCVIINASVHGALVIGMRSLSFHVADKIILAVDFTDARIAQTATLVNTESVQDKYWRYSLHFTDPVSLTWLEHLNGLALQVDYMP